jgi:N-acetylglucosamine kinase-like BadF-type ATPase
VSEAIAVGVDAGGTATRAVATHGGTAKAGPAGASSRGVPAAADAIAAAALEAAGGASIGALYAGVAGAGRASVARALETTLRERFADARIAVEDDARIALRAAIPDGPGAVVIAGTGSVAYAENGDRRARVGGAGYLLGDEGSAFAIGFAAVRLLERALDGRERFDETARLAQRVLGASSRDELLETVYGRTGSGILDVARIAALAPSILAFAAKGNAASRAIVEQAAADLAQLAIDAVGQADLFEQPRIALAGGLLRERSLITSLLEGHLVRAIPGCVVVMTDAADAGPARTALAFAEALLAAGAPT